MQVFFKIGVLILRHCLPLPPESSSEDQFSHPVSPNLWFLDAEMLEVPPRARQTVAVGSVCLPCYAALAVPKWDGRASVTVHEEPTDQAECEKKMPCTPRASDF